LRRIELDGFADPFTLADNPDLTKDKQGTERLFALLESAIAEALEHQPCPDATANSINYLALPQWLDAKACNQLNNRLSSFWPQRDVTFSTITGGATAAWSALKAAYKAIDSYSSFKQIVIATVDSLCEPDILKQAAVRGQLLQAQNSQGYIAGEAAVCLVLDRYSDITQLPANRFALHRPMLVKQNKPWWPNTRKPNPKALVSVLSSALEQAGLEPQHISHLMSDMDGSSWRAEIEGPALNRTVFTETSALPHWRPATLVGQIGVATGSLGWILATLMHNNQIEQVNSVLNWSISPDGKTAACVLERSPVIGHP
jgi:3-oxoacyl-(acyl-carrier-protein) synthase